MKEQKKIRAAYPLAILSLILLCNPNVGVVDILPDFIACFILAKLFSPGTERAPYFMEAKRALVRLGWLNVGKIGGLLLIGYSRMQNSFGNDTAVVVVTVFSAAELVLSISATRAIFGALFGLGERTDMSATITDIGRIRVSTLPTLTYAFFATKATLNVIPNFFLLTRISEDGVVSTVARGYALALVAATVIVLAFGIVWCIKISKYAKAIHKEGQFYVSIYMLSGSDNERRILTRQRCQRMKVGLTLLFAAAITLIDIKFDNTGGINLAPNFIFGIVAMIAIFKLRHSASRGVCAALVSCTAYTVASLESFVMESYFLYNYGYSALLGKGAAHTVYNAVEVLSVIELATFAALAISLGVLLISFVYENTAIPPSDERYSRMDKDYHLSIKRRIIAFVTMLIAVGVARCVVVYSNGFARLILNQQATATVSSALPWMSAVVTAAVVLLIGFSYYLFSTIKEDVDMKYGGV